MTDTLIAIVSIFIGIFGSNVLAVLSKKFTMGFTGNTIAGIFGSIFFIKVFGNLVLDRWLSCKQETLILFYLPLTSWFLFWEVSSD